MPSQNDTPLVGPLKRRGLREIARFAPLTREAHAALVVTRRGRLVTVIPAGRGRALSDYLDWPYELREVDMRERLLVISQRCPSAEVGYDFAVTLQVTYQVTRPEHVALVHEDVVAELEEAIAQRARAIAITLGVEQSSVLKAYLYEALVAGNDLPARFEALGLALRRADIAVELGASERERAETVREQIRDRPLLARLLVGTVDPAVAFDVQVGGFYRVRSRDAYLPFDEAEEIIRVALQQTLDRVGITYPVEEYRAAARAMTDELWSDGVLKAELAASGIELLRPAVHIYLDREQLARLGRPLLLTDAQARDPRIRRIGAAPRLALAAPRELPPPAYLEDAPPSLDVGLEDGHAADDQHSSALWC